MKKKHDSVIIIGFAVSTALNKAIQDQFQQVQQIGNHGFGNVAARIVDELFYTCCHATATDFAKIINTPWSHNELIEMFFK